MATQKTVNWKSAWNQWPKPAAEVVRALRAAVVGEKAPGSRAAPSLRKSDHRERSDRRIVNTEIGPS